MSVIRVVVKRVMCSHMLLWTLACNVAFTVTLYFTGGGFICSLPLFLCLLFILYCGSSNTRGEGTREGVIRSSIVNSFYWIWATDKRLILLLLVFGTYRLLMNINNPSLEVRKGGAYSLILFTALICLLYVLPDKLMLLWSYIVQPRCYGSTFWSFLVSTETLLSVTLFLGVCVAYMIDVDILKIVQHLLGMPSCYPALETQPSYSDLLPTNHRITDHWNASNSIPFVVVMIRDVLMSDGEYLGSMNTFLPTLIGLYLVSRVFLSDRHSVVVLTLFYIVQVACVAGMISALLKHVGHRFRPSAFSSPYVWLGPAHRLSLGHGYSGLDCSFPSGHATVTTGVASVIFLTLINHFTVSLLSTLALLMTIYWFSFLVMINRISHCEHWPSDALFGVSLSFREYFYLVHVYFCCYRCS